LIASSLGTSYSHHHETIPSKRTIGTKFLEEKIIPHFIVSSLANVPGYFLDGLLSPILLQYSFTHLPPTKTAPSQSTEKISLSGENKNSASQNYENL
jgi:hypothetical protein